MQLERYKGVIKMVLAKHAGQSPELVTEELLKSIEIAQALSGEIGVSSNVSIETPNRGTALIANQSNIPIPSSAFMGGAVLISSAPPVAGLDEDAAPDDDVDYWESKAGKGDGCERLSKKLQSILPQSIKIQVPAMDEPLELVRGVGSPGIKFVHVSYSLPGDSLGPRVTLMTSQKDIDPDAILKDIVAQAGAIYSKEKRVIQPRAVAPIAPPTSQDLQNMLDRDRKAQSNLPISEEDIKSARELGAGRASSVRWQ